MNVTATAATQGSAATTGPAAAAPQSLRRTLDAAEARYMQGTGAPATSSVLISNSKYLNSPNYRDTFAQSALRRHGHDLPQTYMIPPMIAAAAAEATLGEICGTLRDEWGGYSEAPAF